MNREAPTRRESRIAGVLLALLPSAVLGGCGGGGTPTEPITGPGDYVRTFELDGRTRSYEVHVPTSVDPAVPAPVVLLLHGVPRADMRLVTGFDRIADERGLIAVYLRSGGTDWSIGCELCTSAARDGVDDVAYARRVIERLSAELAVDGSRVYAAGFSQGALMTHLLACRLRDRLAAAASVAATMLEEVAASCPAGGHLPVAFVHGTEDPEFPWEGRRGGLVSTISAEATVARWAEIDGCAGEPEVAALPDTADDGTSVTLRSYGGCEDGSEVLFYVVEGGGHTWPGSPGDFSASLGRKSRDVEASVELADFFAAQPIIAAIDRIAAPR